MKIFTAGALIKCIRIFSLTLEAERGNIMSDFIKGMIAIVVLYVFLSFIGIGCPIKFITGISCAGCGMTRAWKCFLTGNIQGAFYYHPLFFLPIFFILLLLFKKKISEVIYKAGMTGMLVVFLVVYIIRLLNPNDTVVGIDVEHHFLLQLLSNLK